MFYTVCHMPYAVCYSVMRIGILGGTFDPIHKGHLHIAKEAVKVLKLDKILFIPAGCSPFKTEQKSAETHHRLEMIKLVLGSVPKAEISEIEISKEDISYTIDTLKTLKSSFPKDTKFFLVLGADTYQEIGEWKDGSEIKKYCEIAIAARPGSLYKELKGATHITSEIAPYSSTDIRKELAEGRKPGGLDDKVFDYVKKYSLYT